MRRRRPVVAVFLLLGALSPIYGIDRAQNASAAVWPNAEGAWSAGASMPAGRTNHTATTLTDGTILVAGGEGTVLATRTSAARYTLGTNSWAVVASMATGRLRHFAVRLGDGTVLAVAGVTTATAERYDPTANAWTPAGSLANGDHSFGAAEPLPNGNAIVMGGFTTVKSNNVELYLSAVNTWVAGPNMLSPRTQFASVVLADGSILVSGGFSEKGNLRPHAERYNPTTNSWSSAGLMNRGRARHALTLLADGRVLATGGYAEATAEVYDPGTNSWTPVASMEVARERHTGSLLPDGRVLVAATTSEVYDPVANSWASAFGEPNRIDHTANVLPSGKVLVAAGCPSPTTESCSTATTRIYDVAGVAVSVDDQSVDEGAAATTHVENFLVWLTNPSASTVTVVFFTGNTTARTPEDYGAASLTVTFPPGTTQQTAPVTIKGDALYEPAERFALKLKTPTNAALGDAAGVATILNDDPKPTVSVSDGTVVEGTGGSTAMSFTLSLSAVSGAATKVKVTTVDGTATVAGGDYTGLAATTFTIPAGAPSTGFGVVVAGDAVDEPDETLSVQLTSPTNATIGDGSGTGTITDDD